MMVTRRLHSSYMMVTLMFGGGYMMVTSWLPGDCVKLQGELHDGHMVVA